MYSLCGHLAGALKEGALSGAPFCFRARLEHTNLKFGRITSERPQSAVALLEEGQVIRETYEVERFLGQGAFAEVFRVKHLFLGRQAMKVFKRVGMSLDEIHETMGEAILLSRI